MARRTPEEERWFRRTQDGVRNWSTSGQPTELHRTTGGKAREHTPPNYTGNADETIKAIATLGRLAGWKPPKRKPTDKL